MFSIPREIIITSLFNKVTKLSTNNFKTDVNGISESVQKYFFKIYLFLHKSLFINQSEISSHVVVKHEVEALHRSSVKRQIPAEDTHFIGRLRIL